MNVAEILDAADAHLDSGQDGRARQLFEEAMHLNGGRGGALAGLSKVALRAGDADAALPLIGAALRENPERADWLAVLAAVHVVRDRPGDAEICLRRAMRLDPGLAGAPSALSLIFFARGDADGALELASLACKLDPGSDDLLATLGQMELAAGNKRVAMERFQAVVDRSPQHVDALVGLASLVRSDGNAAGAAELLEKARLSVPDDPHLQARLAECLSVLGERAAAQRRISAAVAVAPSDPEVLNFQGLVMMNTGNLTDAAEAFRSAAAAVPEDPAPLANLALLLHRCGNRHLAARMAHEALALSGGRDEAAVRIQADIQFLDGDWDAAWATVDRLGGIEPGERGDGMEDAVPVLVVDDLSSALLGLRLLDRFAGDRHLRLICRPLERDFFQRLPKVGDVSVATCVDLARDIGEGERVVLLDDLPRLLRATPADLTPTIGFEPAAVSTPADGRCSRVALWLSDSHPVGDILDSIGPDATLLRDPANFGSFATPDSMRHHAADSLAALARALVTFNVVVASDGPVAHLAANLGCRTMVVCDFDVPWHWLPCGEPARRWYPSARAVARDADGRWDGILAACRNPLGLWEDG